MVESASFSDEYVNIEKHPSVIIAISDERKQEKHIHIAHTCCRLCAGFRHYNNFTREEIT